MITSLSNNVSIAKARSMLGKLLKRIKKNNYINLTKDGIPKVAIIDRRLLKYTREFTKKEIKEWKKEDAV